MNKLTRYFLATLGAPLAAILIAVVISVPELYDVFTERPWRIQSDWPGYLAMLGIVYVCALVFTASIGFPTFAILHHWDLATLPYTSAAGAFLGALIALFSAPLPLVLALGAVCGAAVAVAFWALAPGRQRASP